MLLHQKVSYVLTLSLRNQKLRKTAPQPPVGYAHRKIKKK